MTGGRWGEPSGRGLGALDAAVNSRRRGQLKPAGISGCCDSFPGHQNGLNGICVIDSRCWLCLILCQLQESSLKEPAYLKETCILFRSQGSYGCPPNRLILRHPLPRKESHFVLAAAARIFQLNRVFQKQILYSLLYSLLVPFLMGPVSCWRVSATQYRA